MRVLSNLALGQLDPTSTLYLNRGSLLGKFNLDDANNIITIGSESNHGLSFVVANTVSAHLTVDGNLGVGTLAPATRLEVAGVGTFEAITVSDTAHQVEGTIRFQAGAFEGYTGTQWVPLSSATAPRFVFSFDVLDWQLQASKYVLHIAESTHTRGLSPIIQVQMDTGGMYVAVETDLVAVDAATGDISIAVPSTPDLRFAGRVIAI